MEWEDLYDEYGFDDDPDGVLILRHGLSYGGMADPEDHDYELDNPSWEPESRLPGKDS